jgi:hypothetical protein
MSNQPDLPILDQDEAEEARDAGIDRVLSPLERRIRIDEVRKRAFVLARHEAISTDELYEDYALRGVDLGVYLGNPKALAGVFVREFFEPAGWVQSKLVRCHARPKRLWRLLA